MTDQEANSNSEYRKDMYVAFCDILGFSERVTQNFDDTLEVYQKFGEMLANVPFSNVEITIYSDAVLVTSVSLNELLSAVQNLWFVALGHDLMIRGGVAKGRYWQRRLGNHLMVASDALVHAVKLEKLASVPAVIVADDIPIENGLWAQRFILGPLKTPILHFRDRNIVNPFNPYWFASARMRTLQLLDRSPDHKEKYQWFLALHEAVSADADLVPQNLVAKFIQDGFLKRNG